MDVLTNILGYFGYYMDARLLLALTVLTIAILVLLVVSMWTIFKKAGRHGWEAIIPIYNLIVVLQVAGISTWFILIYLALLIPIVGPLVVFMFGFYIGIKNALAFDHSIGFAIGLWLFPFIFYPILAFGDAKYQLVRG